MNVLHRNHGSTETTRPEDSSPYFSVAFARTMRLVKRTRVIAFFATTGGGMNRTLASLAEKLRIVDVIVAASCWRRSLSHG